MTVSQLTTLLNAQPWDQSVFLAIQAKIDEINARAARLEAMGHFEAAQAVRS